MSTEPLGIWRAKSVAAFVLFRGGLLLWPTIAPAQVPPQASPADSQGAIFRPITPEEDRKTATIVGLVVDEAGKPVAGATVRAVNRVDDDAERRTTQTDRAGRFEFADLPPPHWCFSVDDSRFAPQWPGVNCQPIPIAASELPVRITAFAPRTLNGSVVDETGATVAGVTVRLAREYLPGGTMVQHNLSEDQQVTETNGVGAFRFVGLNPGQAVFILDKPGFARTISDLAEITDTGAKLTIRRGLTLRGEVVESDQPVRGATVHVDTVAISHRSMGEWEVQTGVRGRFELRDIPDLASYGIAMPLVTITVGDPETAAFRYEVFKDEDGNLPFVRLDSKRRFPPPLPQTITLGRRDLAEAAGRRALGVPTGTSTIRVVLPPDADVRTARGTHVGLRRLNADDGPYTPSVTFDDAGVATFADLPAGEYGLAGLTIAETNYAHQQVRVADEETVTITLQPGPATLRGRVIAQGGTLVPAYVTLTAISPECGPGSTFRTETKTGEFSISGLAVGRYRMALIPNRSIERSLVVNVAQADTRFEAVLPTGELFVRVADLVSAPNAPFGPHVMVFPRSGRLSENIGQPLNADGTCLVRHLEPGQYIVTSTFTEQQTTVAASVVAGTRTEVELRPPTATGWIEGRIVLSDNAAGSKWAEVAVHANRKDDRGYGAGGGTSRITAGGAFRVEKLAPGTYGLLLSPYASRVGEVPTLWIPDVEVRSDFARVLNIAVPETRLVAFKGARDAASDSATCRLRFPDGTWIASILVLPVRNAIRVPFGRYAIEADFGDGEPVICEFEVTAGADAVEVEIARR